MINYFSDNIANTELPETVNHPLNYSPHPLAIKASKHLQQHLLNLTDSLYHFNGFQNGKMFGVLVIKDAENRIGYLAAFSGAINNQWTLSGFVPPIFDPKLQNQSYPQNTICNIYGQHRAISTFFAEQKFFFDGTGDCPTIKLYHYAHANKLTPLTSTEFWWGEMPEGEIRHHGHFYPASRGKCAPVLPFLLQGLNVEDITLANLKSHDDNEPATVYEDKYLAVINKPHGLLSVPGKNTQDSVLSRLQQRYPGATGPLLLHRLDLDTSGLLLLAKNSESHKQLQQQFMSNEIKKCYVALLSQPTNDNALPLAIKPTGEINLPIRVDLEDRPRQMVCYEHGKLAKTEWKIIEITENLIRIHLYPITGRTHQLRVHAAHKKGLNLPILGDNLYGSTADRLYLHAESLTFTHPHTGKSLNIKIPAPF